MTSPGFIGCRGAVLIAALLGTAAQAQDGPHTFGPPDRAADNFDLLPQTDTFNFDTEDEFYSKRKYSESFRIKGIQVFENVYFGEARVAGERGPGFVVEQGDLSWGFNHRGAEILFRF